MLCAHTQVKTSGNWWIANDWSEYRSRYLYLRNSNLECNLSYTQTLTYMEINQSNEF